MAAAPPVLPAADYGSQLDAAIAAEKTGRPTGAADYGLQLDAAIAAEKNGRAPGLQPAAVSPPGTNAPGLTAVPIGGAPTAPPRPGATPPLPQAGATAAPPPVGNYHVLHDRILAREAKLKGLGTGLDQEDAAIKAADARLSARQAQIVQQRAYYEAHPEALTPDKVTPFQAQSDAVQRDRDALLQRAGAHHQRVSDYETTRVAYQGDLARFKGAPSTAKIPPPPVVAFPPVPQSQRYQQAEAAFARPGIGGPAARPKQDQARALAAVDLAQTFAGRGQALSHAKAALDAFGERLLALDREREAGTLSPPDEARLVKVVQQFKAQRDAHTAAVKAFAAEENQVKALLKARADSGKLLHTGTQYPEELAERLGAPHNAALDWILDKATDIGLGLSKEALKREVPLLIQAQLTGKYPPLPPNPGKTPAEVIQYTNWKNEALAFVRQEQTVRESHRLLGRFGDVTEGSYVYQDRLRAVMANPFERSLLPILRAQVAAEEEAHRQSGLTAAGFKDIGVNVLAALGGVGAEGLAAKLLRPAPWLAKLLAKPLYGDGAAAFLQRLGARTAVRTASGAVGGAGAGFTGTTAAELFSGRGVKESLGAGVRAIPRGALIGGGLAAGLGLAGDIGGRALSEGQRSVGQGAQARAQDVSAALTRQVDEFLNPADPTKPVIDPAALAKRVAKDYGLDRAAARDLPGKLAEVGKIADPAARQEAWGYLEAGLRRNARFAGIDVGPGAAAAAPAPPAPPATNPRFAGFEVGEPGEAAPAAAGAAPRGAAPAAATEAPPPPTVAETPPQAAPVVARAEVGRAPGGYRQATGPDTGPVVNLGGLPVPLRFQDPETLAKLSQETGFGTGNQVAGEDQRRVAGFAQRLQQYRAQTAVPEELRPAVVAALKESPVGQELKALRDLSLSAGITAPETARALARAAAELNEQFGVQVLGTRADAPEPVLGYPLAPPLVSAYRTLLPAERGALPEAVRRTLLVADIVNSTQVLHPGAPPFFTLPGSTRELSRRADNLFRAAQTRAELSETGPAVALAGPAQPVAPQQGLVQAAAPSVQTSPTAGLEQQALPVAAAGGGYTAPPAAVQQQAAPARKKKRKVTPAGLVPEPSRTAEAQRTQRPTAESELLKESSPRPLRSPSAPSAVKAAPASPAPLHLKSKNTGLVLRVNADGTGTVVEPGQGDHRRGSTIAAPDMKAIRASGHYAPVVEAAAAPVEKAKPPASKSGPAAGSVLANKVSGEVVRLDAADKGTVIEPGKSGLKAGHVYGAGHLKIILASANWQVEAPHVVEKLAAKPVEKAKPAVVKEKAAAVAAPKPEPHANLALEERRVGEKPRPLQERAVEKPKPVVKAKAKPAESKVVVTVPAPVKAVKVLPREKAAPATAVPAKATTGPLVGKETVFKAGDRDVAGRFVVKPLAELIASHTESLHPNPAYMGELQPRDGGRIASASQISVIANKLDPRLLGENILAQNGSPIIGPDNMVESGNARTLALAQLYARGEGDVYREWLLARAGEFGIDDQAVARIDRPILVRERTTAFNAEQRIAFTRAANLRATAGLSPTEKARVDAEGLTGAILAQFEPGERGDLNTAANRPFARAFIGTLPPSEQGEVVTGNGELSVDGLKRIERAVFYKAYANVDALDRLAESTEGGLRNILTGMLKAAGPMVEYERQVESDAAHDLSIAGDIATAVVRLAQLRDSGLPVAAWLKQGNLFGDQDPLEYAIVAALDGFKGSGKKVAALLADYLDLATAAGKKKIAGLEGVAAPTKLELWQAAAERVGAQTFGQVELFPEAAPQRDRAAQRSAGGATPLEIARQATARSARAFTGDNAADVYRITYEGEQFRVIPLKGTQVSLLYPVEGPFPQESAEFLQTTANVFHRALSRLTAAIPALQREGVSRVGLILAPNKPGLRGLHVSPRPGESHLFVNPFRGDIERVGASYRLETTGGGDPRATAREIGLTLLHELAHLKVKGEGDELYAEMDRLLGRVGKAAFERTVEEIAHGLTGGRGAGHDFSPQYQSARDRYFGAGRARGSEFFHRLDPLASGTGQGGRHALGSGVSAGTRGTGENRLESEAAHPAGRAAGGQSTGARRPLRQPLAEEIKLPHADQEEQFALAKRPDLIPTAGETTGVWEKIGRWTRSATREYEELAHGGTYSQARQLLTFMQRGKARGQLRAYLEIARTLQGLDKTERLSFEKAIMVNDMVADLKDKAERLALDHPAWSPAKVEAELRRTWRAPTYEKDGEKITPYTVERVREAKQSLLTQLMYSPKVKAAVETRQAFVNDVADEMMHWMERAMGRPPDLSRHDYMHHMVIDYAEAKGRRLPGVGNRVRAVRRGHLIERHGSELPYNTDYIAHELDWAATAIADIRMYKLVAYSRERFDRGPELLATADARNMVALQQRIEADVERVERLQLQARAAGARTETQPEVGEAQLRAAQSFGRNVTGAAVHLADLARAGKLPLPADARFTALNKELAAWGETVAKEQAAARLADRVFRRPRLPLPLESQLVAYAAWNVARSRELKHGLPGSVAAVGFARALVERRAWLENYLGREFVTPESLIAHDPAFAGLARWSPKASDHFFQKLGTAEVAGRRQLEDFFSQVGLTADQVAKLPSLPGEHPAVYLPAELAKTFETISAYLPKDPSADLLQALAQPLKTLQIFGLEHSVAFVARKSWTDLHAMLAVGINPFRWWPQAALEILKVLKGVAPARGSEVEHFLFRGGLKQGVSVGEQPGLKKAINFLKSLDAPEKLTPDQFKEFVLYMYQLMGPEATAWVDSSARFAVYQHFLHELKNNGGLPRPHQYAFSRPPEIGAIEGLGRTKAEAAEEEVRDRAWKLSNDLMVAYDETPRGLRDLADRLVFPYARFQVQNLRRWSRYLASPTWRNDAAFKVYEAMLREGYAERQKELGEGRGGERPPPAGGGPRPPDLPPWYRGTFFKSPRVALSTAMLALWALGPKLLQEALRRLPGEREKWRDLPPQVRGETPLLVPFSDPVTGNTMIFPRISSFTEAFRWMGMDDIFGIGEKIGSNRMGKGGLDVLGQVGIEVGKDMVRELYRQAGPWGAIYEVPTGKEVSFDVFQPRPIRDKFQYVANHMEIGGAYRLLTRMTKKNLMGEVVRVAGLTEYDPLESNYYEIRALVADELSKHGQSGVPTPATAALYQATMAALEGDKAGRDHFLAAYRVQHGKDAGVQRSLRAHDPLAGMKDADVVKWVAALPPDDQERAKGAVLHWKNLVDGWTMRTPPAPPRSMAAGRYVAAMRQLVKAEIHDLKLPKTKEN